ncbi:MAG: AsmA-like C-terminal region-containing protein [Gammaproteobacteria bacterium]
MAIFKRSIQITFYLLLGIELFILGLLPLRNYVCFEIYKNKHKIQAYFFEHYHLKFDFSKVFLDWGSYGPEILLSNLQLERSDNKLKTEQFRIELDPWLSIKNRKIVLYEISFEDNQPVFTTIPFIPVLEKTQEQKEQGFPLILPQRFKIQNIYGLHIVCLLNLNQCKITDQKNLENKNGLNLDLHWDPKNSHWALEVNFKHYPHTRAKQMLADLKMFRPYFLPWVFWLEEAIQKGEVTGEFKLQHAKGKYASSIDLWAENAMLQYSKDWPILALNKAHIQGDHEKLSIQAVSQAAPQSVGLIQKIGNLAISSIQADLDILKDQLAIEAKLDAPIQELSENLQSSPLKKLSQNLFKIQAKGNQHLNLKIQMAMQNFENSKVNYQGEIELKNNTCQINQEILRIAQGKILFDTEKVRAALQGLAPANLINKTIALRTQGEFKFNAVAEFDLKKNSLKKADLNSDLQGLSIFHPNYEKKSFENPNSTNNLRLNLIEKNKNYQVVLNWNRMDYPLTFQLAEDFSLFSLNFKEKYVIFNEKLSCETCNLDFSKTQVGGTYNLNCNTLYLNKKYLGNGFNFIWFEKKDSKKNEKKFESFSLKQNGFEISGAGEFKNNKTSIQGKIIIRKLPALLKLFDYPGGVEAQSGLLNYNLNWLGDLEAFDWKKMEGTGNLVLKNGQILGIDPGLGRLLSLLSFENLPNFFKKAFAFETWNTEWAFKEASLNSKNTKIIGSTANVEILGDVFLASKTLNLRLMVSPKISGTLPLAAGLAGGPLVGAGVWIFDKATGGGVGTQRLPEIYYRVTGDFAKPNIIAEKKKKN